MKKRKKIEFDEFIIDEKDEKRAKTSYIIFGSLTLLSLVATIVLGCFIPHQEDIDDLDGEIIQTLVTSDDGNSFYVSSEKNLIKYDTASYKEIKRYRPVDEIEALLEKEGTSGDLIDNSLRRLSYQYFDNVNGVDYLSAIDTNGNWFKFEVNGDELNITNDYYLVDARYAPRGAGWDKVNPDVYSIYLDSNNAFIIREFDLTNLHNGPIAQKVLWEYDTSSTSVFDTSKTIKPLIYGTGIWDIVLDDTNVYILEDGGVVQASRELVDYNVDGVKINYFQAANDNYIQYLQGYLMDLSTEKKQNLGIDDESIMTFNKAQLESYYSKASPSNTPSIAKEEAAAILKANNDWCDEYDPLKNEIKVNNGYIDPKCQRVVYLGDFALGGSVYHRLSDTFYLANKYDNKIYSMPKSVLTDLSYKDPTLSDLAEPVDTIDLGGRKLTSLFNCISYNEFANTMYVLFANSQTISIVSLAEQKTICTFDANFDIVSLAGNATNGDCISMRTKKSVDIRGVAESHFVIAHYDVSIFVAKNVIVGFFVACLIMAIVWFLLFLVAFLCHKRRKTMFKTKTIIKDLMKNKWVYVALIPFVAMLILFCYYEAVGSILLSFFDYTTEKPAYIWNNFANYIRIFNEPDFWLSVANMLFFLVFDLILCIVPPLIFGFCLTIMRNKKYSGFIRSVMFIPAIIPGIASMLIWRVGIYGDYGVLNNIVKAFGGEPVQFLANPDISRWSLLLMGFPFVGGYLIFYGGLMNIPEDYHEAAELEGLGVFGRFIKIDVPLIMPQIKYIFVMTFISSVQNYARTYMLKSMGTVTPVQNMYVAMKVSGDYGMASAYATLIFIFLLAAIAANFKMQRDQGLGDSL